MSTNTQTSKTEICGVIPHDLSLPDGVIGMDRLLGCVSWIPVLPNASPMGKWFHHGESPAHLRLQQEAALIIQCAWRQMIARRTIQKLKEEAKEKHERELQNKGALVCQLAWRQVVARREFSKLKEELTKATVTCQCARRKLIARRELRKIRKETKERLEKELQSEKKLRADLEARNSRNVAKLQESLHELRLQVEEANSVWVKEKHDPEANEESVPVTKQASDIDDSGKIDSLIEEIESLKKQQKYTGEALKAYAVLKVRNKNLVKEHKDTRKEIDQLQQSIRSFEEKISNLESENQVLRQEVLSSSSAKRGLSKSSTFPFNKLAQKSDEKPPRSPMEKQQSVSRTDSKKLDQKQQDNHDLLIRCISQEIGFSSGRPIAACVIYKSLLQWGSFESEETNIFDRIIQEISSIVEDQENNGLLSYWLSNSHMLLLLLQRLSKPGEAATVETPRKKTPTSFWGRLSQGMRPPQSVGHNGRVASVELQNPALHFKNQLSSILEKLYVKIRENLKKDTSPFLQSCVQDDLRTSQGSSVDGLLGNWQSIVKILDNYLKTTKANYVPTFLVSKMFTQVFSFINMELFNSILMRRECCSLSNGEYMKAGLSELNKWCTDATEMYIGAAWDQLKHVNQAVAFLIADQKAKKKLQGITKELCPNLNIQQLYRISILYSDENSGDQTFSSELISSMRAEITDDRKDSDISSLLLNDSPSIPFSMDDIFLSMTSTSIDISDIEPPPLLRQNSGFKFFNR